MSKAAELELKHLSHLKKIETWSLDVIFCQFYFAGQFGLPIPVEVGRKALEIIIKKLSNANTPKN